MPFLISLCPMYNNIYKETFVKFQITVNDIQYIFFEHRHNPRNISHIEIEGPLLLHKLIYESKTVSILLFLVVVL